MKPRTIWIAAIAAPSLLVMVLRLSADADRPPAAPPPAPPPAVAPPAASRVLSIPAGAGDRDRAELAELRADVARLGSPPAPREQLSWEEQYALDERRAGVKTAVLERTFAADRRDPSWSPHAERKLRDAFAAADVPGGRLEDVSCGATLCRYSVVFDSIAQREDGSGVIPVLARWPSRGFGGPARDDPRRYIMYVSRDPESFPAVE